MDSKKDIIKELKEFNKALENHMPNLELDYIKDINVSGKEKDTEEYFALLANNIMELRTEMALTRKNLSTEVEGMVMRSVSEQQNKFFDQIKKFYGVIIMEIKDNLSNHLKDITDEMNSLKRKYNEISLQNENFANLLDDALIDLKEVTSHSEDNTNSIKDMTSFSKSRFDNFYGKLEQLGNDINKRKFYFEDNLIKLNKRLSRIEGMVEEIAINNGLEDNRKLTMYSEIDEREMDEALKKGIQNSNTYKDRNDSNLFVKKKSEEDETLGKIQEIEKKLKKLNSLR